MSTGNGLSETLRLNDLKRWESTFDGALKAPVRKLAWRTLIDSGCNKTALKSALYYAALTLEEAQDFPEDFASFVRARKDALKEVAGLIRTLRSVMLPVFRGQPVLTHVSLALGLEEADSRLTHGSPHTLRRYEGREKA